MGSQQEHQTQDGHDRSAAITTSPEDAAVLAPSAAPAPSAIRIAEGEGVALAESASTAIPTPASAHGSITLDPGSSAVQAFATDLNPPSFVAESASHRVSCCLCQP